MGLLIPFRYKNLRNKYKTWDFCFQFRTRTVIFCPHFDTKSKDTGKARIICVSNLTQDLYVIRLKDYMFTEVRWNYLFQTKYVHSFIKHTFILSMWLLFSFFFKIFNFFRKFFFKIFFPRATPGPSASISYYMTFSEMRF